MYKRSAWVASLVMVLFGFSFTGRGLAQAPPYENLTLEVSPNGEAFAVGTFYGELIIYAVGSNNVLQTFQHLDDIRHLQWSPDGTRIAGISYFGHFSVWDLAAGVVLVSAEFPTNTGFVQVNWNPAGTQVSITSQGNGTFILDATTGAVLFQLHTGDTTSSLWSPSPYLITADYVGLRVWHEQTVLARILGNQEDSLPSGVAFAPTTNLIALYGVAAPRVDPATGTLDYMGRVLQIYDFTTLELLNTIDLALPDNVSGMKLAWSENGEHIALSSTDGYVRVWSSPTLNLIAEILVDSGVRAFAWLGDAEIIYAPNDSLIDVIALPPPGSTITVTTTADENGTGANCSLREAITAANTNAAFGGCPAGSGDDTILVPAGFYRVNSELVISSPVTINGVDPNATRIAAATAAGGANYRVLNVVAGGDLTLIDTGVYFGGNASVLFGGGIYVQADAHLSTYNVVIASNTAQFGGGLALQGTAHLANTVIMLNQATTDIAALGVDGASASVTLSNVGISENTSAGGAGAIGVSNGATVSGSRVGMINNTAPLGAGGALVQNNGSALILNDSIIEFNTGASGSAVMGATGAVVSIINSCIVGNQADPAVRTTVGSASMTFTYNWWGAAEGPYVVSRPSPTTGESVDDSVRYAGFLTTAPANCGVCPSLNLAHERSARLCQPPAEGYLQPLNAGDGTP